MLFLAPPGVGKTHLAVALGREAIVARETVLFTPATTLVAQLSEARGEARLTHYAKLKLLIIDVGYLPFEPDAAHLLFQLVMRRYERRAMLVTSNRLVGQIDRLFGAPVVASATLDCLLHHSHVNTIRGNSCRLREKRTAAAILRPGECPVGIDGLGTLSVYHVPDLGLVSLDDAAQGFGRFHEQVSPICDLVSVGAPVRAVSAQGPTRSRVMAATRERKPN